MPDLEAKLRFLVSALSRPGAPAERIETHMSCLVLGADEVLKIKKPVRYPFLDFSTPAARERNSREEVRLNRRLAPGVYLGVLALLWDGQAFALRPADTALPAGGVVDWLVRMRRLPGERMLDALVLRGAVTTAHVASLTGVLAPFYRAAVRVSVDGCAYLERIRAEQQDNRAVLLDARFAAPGWPRLLERYDDAVTASAALLADRATARCVVDGHGDLRPEHVCLLDPPVIIDCLEFSAQLREVDPFDEIAFLGIECAVAGAAWIASDLWSRCAEALDDPPPPSLRHLYSARRAVLRARLMVAHLVEPNPRAPERWLWRAGRYLREADVALACLRC